MWILYYLFTIILFLLITHLILEAGTKISSQFSKYVLSYQVQNNFAGS